MPASAYATIRKEMEPKRARPQHASYRAHRRQVAWQITLPVVLAGLILIGVIVLLYWGTFRANGDVDRWAAISTIWLVIPVMIGALIGLAVLIAVAYLLARLAGLIPPYTFLAQKYAAQMEAGAKHIDDLGHRPLMILPEIGRLLQKAFRRMRRG